MNRFVEGTVNAVRYTLAEFFTRIFSAATSVLALWAWFHFSTIYAVIPIVVLALIIGGYLYGIIEGGEREASTGRG
ncbi:MAG: hypothetical protein EA349_02030 [Halomonadaceae bacterium]|nr:MAG: hypothetical protein EA349_02030 [Halomonadaceae bacterium]